MISADNTGRRSAACFLRLLSYAMKYLKQLMVILLFSFVGEFLNLVIPLPVPASIYGMILLFLALLSGVVKLPQIEDTADFLLAIMPVFFISPTVSVMTSYGYILDHLAAFLIICILSTIVTLFLCSYSAQWMIKRRRRKESDK